MKKKNDANRENTCKYKNPANSTPQKTKVPQTTRGTRSICHIGPDLCKDNRMQAVSHFTGFTKTKDASLYEV